jgi:hypothetical protein
MNMGNRGKWDEKSFLEALKRTVPRAEDFVEPAARKILKWSYENADVVEWGTGLENGSFIPKIKCGGDAKQLFTIWTSGNGEIVFGRGIYIGAIPPFNNSQSKRRELITRINRETSPPISVAIHYDKVVHISNPKNRIAGTLKFNLSQLSKEGGVENFLEAFEWLIVEARNAGCKP